jgi:hypothetical protein
MYMYMHSCKYSQNWIQNTLRESAQHACTHCMPSHHRPMMRILPVRWWCMSTGHSIRLSICVNLVKPHRRVKCHVACVCSLNSGSMSVILRALVCLQLDRRQDKTHLIIQTSTAIRCGTRMACVQLLIVRNKTEEDTRKRRWCEHARGARSLLCSGLQQPSERRIQARTCKAAWTYLGRASPSGSKMSCRDMHAYCTVPTARSLASVYVLGFSTQVCQHWNVCSWGSSMHRWSGVLVFRTKGPRIVSSKKRERSWPPSFRKNLNLASWENKPARQAHDTCIHPEEAADAH